MSYSRRCAAEARGAVEVVGVDARALHFGERLLLHLRGVDLHAEKIREAVHLGRRASEFLAEGVAQVVGDVAAAQDHHALVAQRPQRLPQRKVPSAAQARVEAQLHGTIERFAGADETYTIEALMPNGWALQSGTSHFLVFLPCWPAAGP